MTLNSKVCASCSERENCKQVGSFTPADTPNVNLWDHQDCIYYPESARSQEPILFRVFTPPTRSE